VLGKDRWNKFQFQYGAIKGEIGGITFYRIDRFQFQYGAIKGFSLLN